VHGDAGESVVIEIVTGDDVGGVDGSWERRKDTDACSCTRKEQSIVIGLVAGDEIVHDSEGQLRGGDERGRWRMAGHGDSACVAVVMDDVALDDVAVADAGFVGDEDAS